VIAVSDLAGIACQGALVDGTHAMSISPDHGLDRPVTEKGLIEDPVVKTHVRTTL
jgi:hypothetical protein